MKSDEVAQECRRYDDRLNRFGPTPKALGWRDRSQQELRFAVLAEIADLHGASVLDVGCGFGDFFGFLEKRGVHVRYTGVDINPNLLAIARERYPDGRFVQRDIMSERWGEQFDYVFESGVFNHKSGENESFARQMISEMFRICRFGVGVNMMSSYVDYQDDHLYYFQPEEYFKYGKSISKYVVLRHDLPLYEFTMYLLKKASSVK